MPSRPLSDWVTTAELASDGIARLDPGFEINFGDERADARELAALRSGWRRGAVPVGPGYHALALVRPGSARAVIELDNMAEPVRVTPAGTEAIARIEDSWPQVSASAVEVAPLAAEDVVVRYLLLARLAAEGSPPAVAFRILPWELTEQLADDVTAVLGGQPPGRLIALRHWFSPAGSRFTAALEQLDEGLRVQDTAVTRTAATALCTRLLAIDPARLPAATRQALARLADALARQDTLLQLTAARAVRHLVGGAANGRAADAVIRLPARLPAAAASTAGVRRQAHDAVRAPFAFRLAVTATGRAEISLSAPLPAERAGWLATAYGVPLQPVTVTGAAGPQRYLIPLAHENGRLTGQLRVPVPAGRTVEADTDGPAIGVSEARYLDPAQVERSIRALRTVPARELWQRVAAALPPAHPLRAVIAREAP